MVKVCYLKDAFTGFNEADRVIEEAGPLLTASREIIVNITGGTTAMQHIVQELARKAEKTGCRVKRVALIDRRSVEEQRREPYVIGEIVEL